MWVYAAKRVRCPFEGFSFGFASEAKIYIVFRFGNNRRAASVNFGNLRTNRFPHPIFFVPLALINRFCYGGEQDTGRTCPFDRTGRWLGGFARCPRHRAGFGFGQAQKLYEAIRFANFDEGDSSASASVAAQQSVAEVAPVSEISIDLDDLLAEPVRDFLPESAAMPEALDAPVGESAAVPESAPSVKPVSASAVTEPEPEPVLVVASAPVAEPDPVLADESAPESVPVSESAPAAESIAVAVAVSVTSGLSRQDASMEGQSDKASGTGHDAAVRTGREGLAGSSAGQVVAPSSEADAESKQKVVVSDSLFDLDDLVIRHREKRRVIMSLYETDGPQEAAASKIPVGTGQKPGHAAAPQQQATAGKEQDDAAAPQPETLLEKWMNRRSP